MSLISEALRKARQDEASRDAKVRGTVPSTLLRRQRSGGRRLAVGAAIVLAAVGGAAVAWWVLGGRNGPSTTARGAGAPVAAPVPTPAPLPTVAPAASAPAGPTRTAGAPPQAAREPAADAALERALPAATAAAPPTADAARGRPAEGEVPARGALQERAADGTRERVYVIDADLGSVKLHLDYLVYRPGSPFASINGEEVKIGSVIEGYEVEEIGAESVRLRGARGTVVLRTH